MQTKSIEYLENMFHKKILSEQEYNYLKCMVYEKDKMLESMIAEAVLENNFMLFVSLIQEYLNSTNSEKTESI